MESVCSYTSVVMSISTVQGKGLGGGSSSFLTFIVEREKITRAFTESTLERVV